MNNSLSVAFNQLQHRQQMPNLMNAAATSLSYGGLLGKRCELAHFLRIVD
jgi:hypothetical protein